MPVRKKKAEASDDEQPDKSPKRKAKRKPKSEPPPVSLNQRTRSSGRGGRGR